MSDHPEAVLLLRAINGALSRLVDAGERERSPWMDVDAVAAYTGFSPATIRDYVYKEIIPHARPKGTSAVRFNRTDIDKWMAGYKSAGAAGRSTRKIEANPGRRSV